MNYNIIMRIALLKFKTKLVTKFHVHVTINYLFNSEE